MKETINDELKIKDIDTIEKISGESLDIVKENVKKLKEIFPEVFCEDKIDFKRLEEVLGEYTDDSDERYRFEWYGKSKAIKLSQTPSKGTLRPYKEESKNWDTTENLYIEGDNLEVLKLLQKSYQGKIKMIYIDPPYNTGNDFIYPDDYSDNLENYLKITGQKDEEGNNITTNSESSGRYHTNWLNMMYPRLRLARNLLSNNGVIFISIDDNEISNLKKITDEIFGESNYIACFPRVTKKAGKSTEAIAKNNDEVLVYSKGNKPKINLPKHTDSGFKYKDEYFEERGFYKLNQTLDYDSLQYSESLDYPITIDGETLYPGQSYEKYLERKNGKHARADWAWRWSKNLFEFGLKNGFIVVKKYENYSRIYTKTYQNVAIEKIDDEFKIIRKERTKPISSLEFIENEFSNDNSKKNLLSLFNTSIFDYSKPIHLLNKFVSYFSDNKDIILDFFSGSSTTAHAVMQLNSEDNGKRKFIMVQLPEKCDENSEAYKAGYKNICEIGKERIRRAGDKIVEENKDKEGIDDLDIGFKVFKLDKSNIKPWNPDYDNLEMTLEDSVDNFVPGRTEEDIV
ncbi:MAG: site-specific DNA-methyltransferase, partial [Clostridium sp.]|nr:site-specific DNA-methyltransferase [Clostridium sp.]